MPKKRTYDEDSIKVLKGLEGVRAKPSMYIGLLDDVGVFSLVREVMDNAVDEYSKDTANDSMTVVFLNNGCIEVHDNGAGIPVGKHRRAGVSTLQAVTSMLHAGGKMDDSSVYGASRGTHGIGLKATVALSERFAAYTFRTGRWHSIEYRNGKMTRGVRKVVRKDMLAKVQRIYEQGTVIAFKTDLSLFDEGARMRLDMAQQWADTAAYLSSGFKVELRRQTASGQWKRRRYHHDGGIAEWIDNRVAEAECDTLTDKHLEIHTEHLDMGLAFTNDDKAGVEGYCNGLRNADGGTHVNAVMSTLAKSIQPYVKEKENFERADLEEGLLGIVNFKINSPRFSSQTKEKLADPRFNELCRTTLQDELDAFWSSNKKVARIVCERADGMRKARDEFAVLRKSAADLRKHGLTRGKMPTKLAMVKNCSPDERELFLVEGDSAGGTARNARLAEPYRFQETLGLRGKIANAYKDKLNRLLTNEAVLDILSAIGYDPAADDPLANMRVARIILLSDADEDGKHINCLLLGLLSAYVPETFAMGKVFTVVSPKYMLADRGKQYFGMDLDELHANVPKGTNLDKAVAMKGWAEATKQAMRQIAFDPATRQIVRMDEPDKRAARNIQRLLGDDPLWRKRLLGVSDPRLEGTRTVKKAA